ncbi:MULTISPECIES: TIGR03668 family PPOX class F420-dependent oxidoreductase [Pseudonocardia]|uniref:Pyridoxamine 5'-phosphate oxidase n=2 Tax=Pseudonocardia TaxID=1847 RepID=A0A1Y2N3Y1_PSEAH|nr:MULTISPECIES: TIGR03668 family PPOX class F420-dependent oxidoreductase [Pseudonocardia]OSY41787.1 Pyridoxamine 5'-phosphate oxidase [Pseudonocardia autotrophica]TDN71161.1 PPOX class probable F420-dependent enzyme [Pseudonocardia autotrophica]BBG01830.1 PPOX class F420-dependent oxidoreductase [Pseudonocardia autotrophica]GEC22996.1 PPOX class F420-dependent oxidoreductase [Pseudonocardia saturnea]
MPALSQSTAGELLASARVARLATIRPADGTPRLVPITFALVDDVLVSVVDRVKAKRHTRLARLRDIAADPRVGLLADHYDDDWSQLWWVRVDAVAELHTRGEIHERAIAALAAKYPPYAAEPPDGDVLVLTPTRWTGWSAH